MKRIGLIQGSLLPLIVLISFMLSSGAMPAFGGDQGCTAENREELADLPLEVRTRSAPALINLVLDNTRNMYWTIMTREGTGSFTTSDGREYQLVFPEDTFAGAEVLPYADRAYWKTQWSGHNTMYYNPAVNYVPWPRWEEMADNWTGGENANPDDPRMHPMDSRDTLDLNEMFFAPGYEGIGEKLIFEDIVFNDADRWTRLNPSERGYISDDNHFYATSAAGETASWSFEGLTGNDRYDIYVYIPYYDPDSGEPDHGHTDGRAVYTVTGQSVETRTLDNQKAYDGWTPIATNMRPHNQNDNLVIELARDSGTVSADAARIVYAGTDVDEEGQDAVDMIFAHYYVKGDDGEIYLVNLDGEIEYYHFEDQNNNSRVDEGELTRLDPAYDQAKIDAAGIQTGRTYEQERRNFANWYQFYRKRSFTGIGAVSQFLVDLTDAYFRMIGFPPASFEFPLEPIQVSMDDGEFYDETDTVLENLYHLKSPQAIGTGSMGTSLQRAGEFFDDDQSTQNEIDIYADSEDSPFFKAEYGGECQQAFAIIMTGGFWSTQGTSSLGVGDQTGDGYTNTLADVAKYYWQKDLKPTLENLVPESTLDDADWQHLVTYGISFGVEGSLNPADWPDCNLAGDFDCPVWPEPQSFHRTTIDDLWHATVAGRGMFVNAANPEELVQALKDILNDIEIRTGTATSISTNSVQRRIGTMLYQGTYHSGLWTGDLLAKPIDVDTGDVKSEIWSAGDALDSREDWRTRNIYTYTGTAGTPFEYNQLSAGQQDLLGNDSDIVDYIRGDRDLEIRNGGSFRNRGGRLGSIVHSSPVYHRGVVYVGANDGMLHAFDAEDGEEIMAYVPNLVFENLAALANPVYWWHQYYVNGTPYVKTVDGNRDLLVGGLGKGGRGYYGLDISDVPPDADGGFDADDVLWEYTAVVDDDMGYSYSRAFIVKTRAEGWVVIFGNGYNSVNGEAVLYVLDALTGEKIKKFHTGVFGCNGIPADVAIIDSSFDDYADFVYAGDIKGNLWKFDISGDSIADWQVAYRAGDSPRPLFTAKNEWGETQPITSAPDVMRHCLLDRPGYMVIFGTGQYVSELDFDDHTTQSLYGIWDWQEAWEALDEIEGGIDPEAKYLGEFQRGDFYSLSNAQGWELLEQEVVDKVVHEGDDYLFVSDNEIDYWSPVTDEGEHVGWFFDLPQEGERTVQDPMIRDGIVMALGSVPVPDPCWAGGSSVLYQLDACTGGEPDEPQFDVSGDGRVHSGDLIDGRIPSGKQYERMLYSPVATSDRIYMPDERGHLVTEDVRSLVGGELYWHEIGLDR